MKNVPGLTEHLTILGFHVDRRFCPSQNSPIQGFWRFEIVKCSVMRQNLSGRLLPGTTTETAKNGCSKSAKFRQSLINLMGSLDLHEIFKYILISPCRKVLAIIWHLIIFFGICFYKRTVRTFFRQNISACKEWPFSDSHKPKIYKERDC